MKGSLSLIPEGEAMIETAKPYYKIKFCPFCGTSLDSCPDEWPEKTCRNSDCGKVIYHPIKSVGVLIVFVERTGIVFIKRGIKPEIGGKALPGGHQVFGEAWQDACARETDEETQVKVVPSKIILHDTITNPDGHNIIFGVAHVLKRAVGRFLPSREVTERMIIPHHGVDLCFSSHRDALTKAIHTYGPEGRATLYT